MKIAVLALQGAFKEHEACLEKLETEYFEIRRYNDLLKEHDGIIIPGGESTTMSKLLVELNLLDAMADEIKNKMPVFGTCAGLILLARDVENSQMPRLGTMNIEAKRNAYGRQLGSFCANEKFADSLVPMTFIRAPYIKQAGEGVEILAAVDEKIVAAREDNQLVCAFHPELTDDLTVHKYFLNMI